MGRGRQPAAGPAALEKERAGYDSDFYAWSQQQGRLVREGRWSEVDRENVAEEIESLGREQFNKLEVWVDGDGDGKTDAGELRKLADLGITELDLHAQKSSEVDNGNLVGLVSGYKTADGQTHEMADVWFARDRSAPATATPKLDDLLAAAPTTQLPGAEAMPAAAAPVTPDQVAAYVKPKLPGEDDNGNNTPLI